MTTVDSTINQEKAEAFGGRVLGLETGAALTFMLSIGHQTGLFDVMAGLAPATSEEIAAATGLNERYVREWLNSLVTGGIVEYAAAQKTYRLPPEHAASLTRSAGPNNLASLAQYFAPMGQIEPQVIESFRSGGGVPYSEFPRFQTLQREESAQIFDATLLSSTLPLVPALVGQLERGIDVADVGCGAGHAICLMAEAFPLSRFVGYDFSEEGVGLGRAEAEAKGLENVSFEVKDVATLAGPPRFDLITAFDAIHDQAHPRGVLKGIAAALRPEGVFLCVDIAGSSNVEENMEHALAPILYMVSVFHCMTVSLALGGEGLGTMWGEQKARELFEEAGFGHIEVKKVDGDFLNSYYVLRK